MTVGSRRAGLAALLALAGCATRAEMLQTDRQLHGMILEQRQQLQSVQREVERLRAELDESGPRGAGSGRALEARLRSLEGRVEQMERGEATPALPPGSEGLPPVVSPEVPPGVPPEPVAAEADGWRQEVAAERSAAGAVGVPERAEYLKLLDGVAAKDCARSEPQMNAFATAHKGSPLADNALYWAARCYELRGDSNQAIQKYYDVVTRYPKGDKAPAALWAQGNLFLALGDTPDARVTLSKLVREYPATDEAARARQKLSQLEN